MCGPLVVPIIMAVAAVVSTAATVISANKTASAEQKALNLQASTRDTEIAQQESTQLTERAEAARRERAAARVAASQSGVNLDSNSFLAQLSASAVHEQNDNGLIMQSAADQRSATSADYDSELSKIHYTTGIGVAVDAAQSGYSAYKGAGGTMPSGS